jgi:sugar O-acyltransferase (sialic acid O-acetyltransferase NeuD family)
VKKLIIYGAGGLGREVKSMLSQCINPFMLIGFLDDGRPAGTTVEDIPVLGGVEWLSNCPSDVQVVLAIGDPKTKANVVSQIKPGWHIQFATIIHARATIQALELVTIGPGSIVGAGSVLTTGITIGDHVLINLNVTVGHDTVIGDCSSIMPGVSIAGEVTLGRAVMIGSGADVINQIRIGDQAVIGAGSVVNHDIPAGSTAAGVPARVIKLHGNV